MDQKSCTTSHTTDHMSYTTSHTSDHMSYCLVPGHWGTQMQFGQLPLLALVGARDQSGWTMFSVRGMRHNWTCAHSQDGALRTVDIMKMQAWSAIVSVCVCVCVCVRIVCMLCAHTYITHYQFMHAGHLTHRSHRYRDNSANGWDLHNGGSG